MQILHGATQGDNPKVSVIIPTYNRVGYIGGCIESVLRQTRKADEVIVVDDGSADATEKIVKKFGSAVIYHWQENAGQAHARNAGMAIARSDWVAFLDSDDYWEPHFIAKMVRRQQESPESKIIYCYLRWVDESDAEIVNRYPQHRFPEGWIFYELFHYNYIKSASCVLAEKEFLKKLGGFRKIGHSEDYDLWLRGSATASVAAVPEKLVNYRRHDGNISNDGRCAIMGRMEIRQCALGMIRENKVNPANSTDAPQKERAKSVFRDTVNSLFSDGFYHEVRTAGTAMILHHVFLPECLLKFAISLLPVAWLRFLERVWMVRKRTRRELLKK